MDEDTPTPDRFYHPTPVLFARVQALTDRLLFFHWELEFPDVFVAGKGGFDVVVGNPPWEISKPNSQEFFSRYDPIYRTRKKQEGITLQKEFFSNDSEIERAWLTYVGGFKAMGNWNRCVAFPFGDPAEAMNGGDSISLIRGNQNWELHSRWRNHRARHSGFIDQEHPFRYQGSSDINTYKMFLEQAYTLCRFGGRFGFIVPSGIYTDKGSTNLRGLFIDRCKWEWLFGFENKKKIFQIHSSYKFCSLVIEKGGTTLAIRATFMHHDLASWEAPYDKYNLYGKEQIIELSPKYRTLCEIRSYDELKLMQKIFKNGILFFESPPFNWGINYQREYDIPGDMAQNKCPDVPEWYNKNYGNNGYDKWINPEKVIAVPVIEGEMITQFDFSNAGWVSGKGRTAIWRDIPLENKKLEPQYLVKEDDYTVWKKAYHGNKLIYKGITSTTNTRTAIAAYIGNWLCDGNIPVLTVQKNNIFNLLQLSAIFNSFIFDFIVRIRLGGNKLTRFVLEDTVLPISNQIKGKYEYSLIKNSSSLSLIHQLFAPQWLLVQSRLQITNRHWKSLWAVTPHERLRLRCILDAIIAELYGLSFTDFAWILRDCGYPKENIRNLSKTFDPKGFWRVGKDKDPELRQTFLSLRAFADLKEMGIDAFCAMNDSEGWMIPETITYKINIDGTITFDTRDGKTVSVRGRLGPRFFEWQLAEKQEESWRECKMHARNILGEEGFAKLMQEINFAEGDQQAEDRFEVAEKLRGGERATDLKSIADILKKAEEQKKDQDRKQKEQSTLGEW